MPNARRRNGWKRWTEDDVRVLRELARANVPKEMIGLRMGRSPEAVAQRAWLEGLALPGRRPRTKADTQRTAGVVSTAGGEAAAGHAS
ncbi:MAG: hypothetical protein U0842_17405 [Candidatus Binatia bacterium]